MWRKTEGSWSHRPFIILVLNIFIENTVRLNIKPSTKCYQGIGKFHKIYFKTNPLSRELEREEKKLELEIKKAAKTGNKQVVNSIWTPN